MNIHRSDDLLAGVGRTDITPPANTYLSGFAARTHGAEGVHDNLTATALALSKNGSTVVIVALDLIGITDNLMENIRARVGVAHALEPRSILVNCSHTHGGPILESELYVRNPVDNSMLSPDSDYLDRLIENIVCAIDMAIRTLRPSRAFWSIGETAIGICRRAINTGINAASSATDYGIFPNPDGIVDRTCPVIMVEETGGQPFALVFGASCHPTTLKHDNYLVTAEYPGTARRILEREFGGVTSLFLQGISGDVKPRQVAGVSGFRNGTYDDVESIGRELAADVRRTVDAGLEPLDVAVRTSLDRFPIPLAGGWDAEKYRFMTDEAEPEYHSIWAQWWLDILERGETLPSSIEMPLSLVEISPNLRFVGIPGELLTAMGMKIKAHFTEGVTLPLSYTNGDIAYVPDSQVVREGGYEGLESVFFSTRMASPWREDIDDNLLRALWTLKKKLK